MSEAAQLPLDFGPPEPEDLPTWARVACPDCGAAIGQPCELEPGDPQGGGRTSPWRVAHDLRHGAAFVLRSREREAEDLEEYPDEIEPGERNQWDRWLAGETGPLEEWVAKIAAYVPPRKPSKKRSKKAAAA